MKAFFKTHQCSELCRLLGLKNYSKKSSYQQYSSRYKCKTARYDDGDYGEADEFNDSTNFGSYPRFYGEGPLHDGNFV